MRTPYGLLCALDRVRLVRRLDLIEELDELRERERPLAGGVRVDDSRRKMDTFEAENEIRLIELLAFQGPGAVAGDIEPGSASGVECFVERRYRPEVVEPERGDFDLRGRARAEDRLCERASEAVSGADEDDLENVRSLGGLSGQHGG